MTELYWTIENLLEATGAELLTKRCPERFAGVRIDSRKTAPGDLFVAIAGMRFDGHDFIDDVVDRGVRCVIVGRAKIGQLPIGQMEKRGVCCLAVTDTIAALGSLAGYQRRRAAVPVVAITGSNGKTSTKEMTAAICRQRFATLATMGNFNNEIGLPLTLFNLESAHEVAVLELGMSRPGEIRRLSAICRPDIGVITNIGPAHLEGLGDIETVARAKGELLENIHPEGTVVLNADDAYGLYLKAQAASRVMMFGISADADVRAERITQRDGRIEFTLALPDSRTDIRLNVYGSFMTYNALAAATAAHLLGIGPEDIKKGLEGFRAVKGRMAIYETSRGAYIIDDTYNANPGSMAAAIKSLSGLTSKKRGILVAGDMLELGEAAASHHEQIGRIAAEASVTRLYLTGEFASRVAQGARSAGMAGSEIFVGTKADIIKDLDSELEAGDWVLVKGSRSTGMEDIVEKLTDGATVCNHTLNCKPV